MDHATEDFYLKLKDFANTLRDGAWAAGINVLFGPGWD